MRENFFAIGCENGFRVKLHAVHGELVMTQGHDLAVLAFRSDFEACREGTPLDDQRVVSTGFKRCGQIDKKAASVVSDAGCLPMHKAGSTRDFSAIRFGDALMSKTNAQDRNLRAKAEDDVFADPRFTRRAGPRRDADMFGRQRSDFIKRDFIIPLNDKLAPKLAKILGKVVSERVVVVDQE